MTATTEILDLVRRRAVAERNSGRFRVTVVAVRPADRWLLANVHIGPLQPAGPPSA